MAAPYDTEAPARILAKQRDGVYQASMPNGKVITAFIPPKFQANYPEELPADTMVIVKLPTFDFSAGKILRLADLS